MSTAEAELLDLPLLKQDLGSPDRVEMKFAPITTCRVWELEAVVNTQDVTITYIRDSTA